MTLAPAVARREATIDPPGPLPTMQTSGRSTRSCWTSAPVTMRPAISPLPGCIHRAHEIVGRPRVADRGIRLGRAEVDGGGESLQRLEASAADGEPRSRPRAEMTILLLGRHLRERPRRPAQD